MTTTARRWLTWLALAAFVLAPLTLLPNLGSSTDVARLRNAMVFGEAPRAAFEWQPGRWPADFLLDDDATPQAYFVALAHSLELNNLTDDWSRALAISKHLLSSQPRLTGGAIQAPLQATHRRIVETGAGYCADFVRVFQALAAAAGMPLRTWAFSFDGFGGDGHIVVEIWNREQQRWQMLDLFNNVYFQGTDGQPLAALAVRDGFLRDAAAMRSVPLVPQARPGFRFEDKLRAYYLRGLNEWYLWWGNNPYGYENAASVRWLTPVARPVAQLGAIVQGVQPHAIGLATEANAERREQMRWLGWQLWLVAVSMMSGLLVLIWLGWQRWARGKARPSAMAGGPGHAR